MNFLDLTRKEVACTQMAMLHPHNKLVVGAAVVHTAKNGRREILLLKRAALESYYPGVFEIPGGKVDESDPSVRAALTREVVEETGLAVSRILNALQPFTYTNEKQNRPQRPLRCYPVIALQLSYVVEVQGNGDDFVVNPNEHSKGTWATFDTIPALPMTDEMRDIALEALKFVAY